MSGLSGLDVSARTRRPVRRRIRRISRRKRGTEAKWWGAIRQVATSKQASRKGSVSAAAWRNRRLRRPRSIARRRASRSIVIVRAVATTSPGEWAGERARGKQEPQGPPGGARGAAGEAGRSPTTGVGRRPQVYYKGRIN